MTGPHEMPVGVSEVQRRLGVRQMEVSRCGVTYQRKVTEPPVSDWERIAQIAMTDVLALQQRSLAAEKLLLEADETIEILHGDMNSTWLKDRADGHRAALAGLPGAAGMTNRVEENRDGKFDLCIGNEWIPDTEVDLAELVELHTAVSKALFDYLARNVARLKMEKSDVR